MNDALKSELLSTMMHLRKTGMPAPPGEKIRFAELCVLEKIPETGIGATEIQNDLLITKPAVSQILSLLEHKGLIRRQPDAHDRRKIKVTLTEAGRRIKDEKARHVDRVLDMTIARLGRDNTRELIRLLNLLADITQDIRHEFKACGDGHTKETND